VIVIDQPAHQHLCESRTPRVTVKIALPSDAHQLAFKGSPQLHSASDGIARGARFADKRMALDESQRCAGVMVRLGFLAARAATTLRRDRRRAKHACETNRRSDSRFKIAHRFGAHAFVFRQRHTSTFCASTHSARHMTAGRSDNRRRAG